MGISNFVQNTISCDKEGCSTAPFTGSIPDASEAGWTNAPAARTPLAEPVAPVVHCPTCSA